MEKEDLAKSSDNSIEVDGLISQNLSKDGIQNESLANDHIGFEKLRFQLSSVSRGI